MKVLRELGRGGFAIVEECEFSNGKRFARKTFSPRIENVIASDRVKLLCRFKRETKIQSRLPEKFFVPIVRQRLDLDPPWFLMPVADRNYAAQIATDRTNNRIQSSALAQVLDALECLHELGYTHRDLKPENVLLHDGRWKLSDLGFVMPPAGVTTALTSTGSVFGTQEYCAPEQYQDFKRVTPAADIYSFGCILHDLVDGSRRIPFQRHTAIDPIGIVIEKCTEINPKKRFKSIQELRSALFSVLSQPSNLRPSVKAEEWAESLRQIDTWDNVRAEEFARFVNTMVDDDDRWAIFMALDSSFIQAFQGKNPDVWELVMTAYCSWVRGVGFDFEYCDVLVAQLELVFSLGSPEAKAAAVLAIAHLGASHNRWFVMRRLFALCGSDLPEHIARRIAIEICVEDLQHRFQRCAETLNRDISEFHELIAYECRIKPDT